MRSSRTCWRPGKRRRPLRWVAGARFRLWEDGFLGSIPGGITQVFGGRCGTQLRVLSCPSCVLHQTELYFISGGTRERDGLVRPIQVISHLCAENPAFRYSPSSHPTWQDRVPSTFLGQKPHPARFGRSLSHEEGSW